MKPWKDLWTDVRQALTNESAHKELEIKTYVSGSEIFFEVKIPRHTDNNLFMTSTWRTSSRAEAAAFMRELVDVIEKGSTTEP